MTVPAPLTFPLAGLLAEPPGSERRYEIHGATIRLPEDMRLVEPLDGELRISRTNRGVLIDATISTAIAGTCSRCLRDIEVPIQVSIEDEVLPSIDFHTGAPVPPEPGEDEPLRLTDHHELDLETPIREAIQLAEPIAPLCRPDCPGLCIVCGLRLDDGEHDHPDDDIDPRMEALRGFRPDGA